MAAELSSDFYAAAASRIHRIAACNFEIDGELLAVPGFSTVSLYEHLRNEYIIHDVETRRTAPEVLEFLIARPDIIRGIYPISLLTEDNYTRILPLYNHVDQLSAYLRRHNPPNPPVVVEAVHRRCLELANHTSGPIEINFPWKYTELIAACWRANKTSK
jgi:hypothetical protein